MTPTSTLLADSLNASELAAFAQQWADQLRAEQQALEAFSRSATFWRMRQALLERGEAAAFGDEDLSYFREETLRRLGWEDVCEQDVEHFVRLVVDPQGPGVLPDSCVEDETCRFGNVSFVSWGLAVRMLFGQGTSWQLRPVPLQAQDEPGSA